MFLGKIWKVSKSIFFLKSRTKKILELESFTLYKNCNLCCDLRCTAKFSAFGYSGPVSVVDQQRHTEPISNHHVDHWLSRDDRHTKPARSRTTTGDTRDLLWLCLRSSTDSYFLIPPRSVADSTLHQNVRANLAPNEVGPNSITWQKI